MPQEEEKKQKTVKSEILEWILSIAVAVALALLIKIFLIDFVLVQGSSMVPTLENNDRLIINKIEYLVSEPDYGDIVILQATETKDYVKRVIGKGGDVISIKNSIVYRNGEALEEDYISSTPYDNFGPITVPEGEYFVMGDNRANSLDSRYTSLGCVEKDRIKGHVIFRIWPLSKFGTLD